MNLVEAFRLGFLGYLTLWKKLRMCEIHTSELKAHQPENEINGGRR